MNNKDEKIVQNNSDGSKLNKNEEINSNNIISNNELVLTYNQIKNNLTNSTIEKGNGSVINIRIL
ncbi:hypothetical protein H9L25_05940 [Terrisporobacter mayombei]|nr:hypothetical protein [Terrisporobacter mayombei]